MDPSAQQALPNPMEQQLANSSQLGGGANGDHSKINGDQVIVNPLSTQLRDQQQSQMAAQIAATNRAQAMVQSQVKEAQQAQQKLSPSAPGTSPGTVPGTSQSPTLPGTIQNPTSPGTSQSPVSQPAKPATPAPSGNPVPQPPPQPAPGPSQNPATPGTMPGTMQNPVAQSPATQNQSQQPGAQQMQQAVPQQSVPQQQAPVQQQPQQPVQQQGQVMQQQSQMAQPQQVMQPQQMQQGQVMQQQPQMAQQQQQVQPMQPQMQPGFGGQSTQGIIQSPVSQQQGQVMQQQPQMTQPQQVMPPQPQQQAPAPQQFPVQQQQPVAGTMPGTIQNPAAPGTIQSPASQPAEVATTFQMQQAVPQTAPVAFQTFGAPQGQPSQQPGTIQSPASPGTSQSPASDPNAAQPGEGNNDQSMVSVQQAIADTFIPVSQLISSNHDPIQDLHHKVASSNVPDELRVILNDRIKRLGLIKEGAGLSSMYILELESTTRYINACTGLPWVEKTEDTLDLTKAKEILDKHHYGLDLLKNRMLEFIASIMLNIKNNGPDFASRSPILCFVGLAGTGKTTFAKSMAEALGRKFERIPFGGMADSRALRGQSRYFPDAEPGAFLKSLARAQSKNPVLLLDEIDRVTETARADIMGVLIEALDPEQNAAFTDHYIDYPFSLQNCLFVATSNNISTIATAVLDRMEIIQMPNYNDEEKKVIGRDYVLPKVRSQMGLREDQLIIDESVWDAIIRPLGYDPGVRALDRIIGMICRRAARMIVAGEAENVRVTINNMKPFVQDF